MKYKFRKALSPRALRAQKVDLIKKDLATAKSIILFASSKVPHLELEGLRHKLEEAQSGAKLRFVKNTLFRVAAKDAGLPEGIYSDEVLKESTAVLFVENEDFITAIKVLKEVFGKNENVSVKIALLDNELYQSAQVMSFASIPSKQELYGKLVGSMKSPIYGLYYALTSDLRKLAFGLQAVSSKLQ
jgi:large subunit ribosomal protein L10